MVGQLTIFSPSGETSMSIVAVTPVAAPLLPAPACTSLSFEDLTSGQHASLLRTVMAGDLQQFSAVSGDVNPIHISDDFAVKTTFGQRIAHGMFTASLISALLGTRLPGPGAVYLSQTLKFLAPVRIGDVVTATVEVAEMIEKGRRVRLDCHCLVDGKPVLEGEAWVMVPAGPAAA